MSSEPNAERSRVSVAMIVRDEASVVAESIDSVREIADEVFVLDTGSSDDTVRIAEASGARVATLPWTDDFSTARNSALDQVDGDWVLWLDAGERLTDESRTVLRQFVDGNAEPGNVYMLMVVVPTPDPSTSAEQAARIRLMPNVPGLRFCGRVREGLDAAVKSLGLGVEMAPGRILRHRRDSNPSRKSARARRDLRIATAEGRQLGTLPVRLLLTVGEAFSDLHEPEKARKAFLQATQTAERGSTVLLDAYYGLLTTFDGVTELQDQQLSVGLEALETYPLDAQLLCAMGSYLQVQNRLDLAERSFETALKYGQVNLETWHLAEIAEMAAVCLALTQQLAGKSEESREVLLEALDRFPESTRVRRHLVDLLVKLGRRQEALELSAPFVEDGATADPWKNAVLGACHAAGKEWLRALGYLQSAYVGGCRDPFCLRWLVVTLFSSGQVEAARPVLDEWLEREPSNAEALAYLGRLEEEGAASDSETRTFRVDQADQASTASPVLPVIDTKPAIDPASVDSGH